MATKFPKANILESNVQPAKVSKGTKKLLYKGMFILTAGFTFLAVTNPASAASASCRIIPSLGGGYCETATIAANRSGHFVRFYVSPGSTYKVKDIATGATLATGTAGLRGKSQTIFGLYGQEYQLRVDHAVGGFGYINNN